LDYAEARYHGAVYGRFTSVDPALGSARKSLPQSWNRYTYVMNQPLSLIDPTGEFWIYREDFGGRDLRFIRKGSPTDEERKKYTTGAYIGYQIIEDNTPVQFGGGGTGRFAQYNHERAVLGDDGEIHVVRSNAGDKVGALAIALYFSAGMAALTMPEFSALSALELAILTAQLYGMGEESGNSDAGAAAGIVNPEHLSELKQGQAQKAISNGIDNVMVKTRAEADAIRRTIVEGQGYENTSGLTGKEVREMLPEGKSGTFHWDYADTKHGGTPHVQIHTHEGRTIRIFFKEGGGLPIRLRGRVGRGR
jgi:hypothetical protein